jgi:hypothetical protein
VQKIREKEKRKGFCLKTHLGRGGDVVLINKIMPGFSFSCGFWVKLGIRESNGLCFVH